MGYTMAQRKKFFELVKKYSTATRYNEEAIELSKAIKQMSKSNQGLAELAQLITEQIEEEMEAYDIRPLLFGEVKPRELNEKVEYKRKGKFRAYRITRGGYVPKSEIFHNTVTAVPEEFAVRPACHLDQLETGRISSVQELRQGAIDAVLTEYANYFYEVLDTVAADRGTPADASDDGYAEVNSAVDKATLDAMLYWASEKGTPVIVGTHQSLAPIMDFEGHTDGMKEEIQRTGSLGMYRGARIVKLEQFTDADENPVIKSDRIFVFTESVGHVDDFGEMRVREIVDGEHDEFSIIMRKQMGITVMKPDRVGIIKIT